MPKIIKTVTAFVQVTATGEEVTIISHKLSRDQANQFWEGWGVWAGNYDIEVETPPTLLTDSIHSVESRMQAAEDTHKSTMERLHTELNILLTAASGAQPFPTTE